MRVLGIDPGSRHTGLGVVEVSGDGLRAVTSCCINMRNDPLPKRLNQIYRGVQDVISEFSPEVVAVEQVFVSKNAKSALILGHARGSAICSAVNLGLEIREYSALQVKQAVVGSGNAKKEQVQHMVRALLGMRETPAVDEADALACAICHIHTWQVNRKLASACQ